MRAVLRKTDEGLYTGLIPLAIFIGGCVFWIFAIAYLCVALVVGMLTLAGA